MKKIAALITLTLALALLAGCSSNKLSTDPLVAKWVLKYDEGKSQVLFNFEAIGDLDVVIWHYDEASGEFKQAEDYVGGYTVDEAAGTITYVTNRDGTYVFGYKVEDKVQLTITYEDKTIVLPYVETNSAK